MKKKNMQIPKSALNFSEDVDIKLAQDDDGNKYFSMEAYSGKIIKNHSWWGDLAIDVSGIKFTQKRIPILEQHSIEKKIGVSNKRPVLDGKVSFEKIKLMNNTNAQEFEQNLSDDFPYQASISIRPLKIEHLEDEKSSAEVNGHTIKGPARIIREAMFREASVCVFGADPNTSVTSLSDEKETFEIEFVNLSEEDKTENKTGGNDMDLEKLKKEHPELYKKVQEEALSAPQNEIEDLKKKNEELSAKVTDLEKEKTDLADEKKKNDDRIASLEKAEALRQEKDMRNKAEAIKDKKLSESKIPKRLHERVKKAVDFNEHVKESVFDDVEFAKQFDAEIKSWADDLEAEFADSATILGFSTGGEADDKNKETEDLSDTLVGFVSEATDNEKK